MKQFKVKIHQQNFSEETVLFNAADLPGVKQNSLLKVVRCDGNPSNYLLYKVKILKDGLTKDTISVEQNMANSFGFQLFQDVYVSEVEAEEVTIDLLEVSFKDQYISRSDMWRMKKHLLNSCAYIDQYLQYSDIRAQVSELWVNTKMRRCGYITDSTNFVLRSLTAKVYVFIQMSSEMWEYDSFGYLQFERAVNGILKALFTKWKEKKCCHELTLVLFSRTFYETCDVSEFPESVQESVRKNYRGQLYLDFYKCVVQTEKLEDCIPLLMKLKKLFHKYDELTSISGCPEGTNSTSSEGNFLEAINMSLNVFERHNVNRNFDGTGQIVVCITPGVGVFDVDRDLTILTKERMIDNGIGSDLICLGQQPLHAVPLFKFHHKPSEWQKSSNTAKGSKNFVQPPAQDFNIPHWINHSFYTSNPFPDKGTTNIKYIPRVHIPTFMPQKVARRLSSPFSSQSVSSESDELPDIQQLSFAEFDKQVFGFQKPTPVWKKMSLDNSISPKHGKKDKLKKNLLKLCDEFKKPNVPNSKVGITRPVHIPLCKVHGLLKSQEGMASSLGAAVNLEKHFHHKQKEDFEVRPVIGSATTSRTSLIESQKPVPVLRRALFNPFNPSHMFAPLTANRRRWVHTYPRGPQGEALVLHHQNTSFLAKQSRFHRDSTSTDEDAGIALPFDFASSPYASSLPAASPNNNTGKYSIQHVIPASFEDNNTTKASSGGSYYSSTTEHVDSSPAERFAMSKGIHASKPITSYGLSWIWGIAGDTQWTSYTNTGLDWKSLKCPACLPITTDYCPMQSDLQTSYTEQSYTLVPDDITFSNDKMLNDEQTNLKQEVNGKEGRSAEEIFLELVNQRLCQGFQIIKGTTRIRSTDSASSCATIISPNTSEGGSFRSMTGGTSPMFASSFGASDGERPPNSFMLSHGRQYHIVHWSRDEEKIEVKIYRPRHPFKTVTIDYTYMLWPKTRAQFQVARTSFAHEKMEDYYWNHQDGYICNPDENEFQLSNLKCWQSKFVVVVTPQKRLDLLKQANENSDKPTRYDVFDGYGYKQSHDKEIESGESTAVTEGFVKFLEHLNKFKRKDSHNSRKSWKSFSNSSNNLSKSYNTSSSGAFSSNHATPTPPARPTSSTPTGERFTPIRSIVPENMYSPSQFSGSLTHGVDAQPVPVKSHASGISSTPLSPSRSHSLSVNSDLFEVIAAMKHHQSGLSFLPEHNGLPKHTFASLDAVHWAIESFEDISTIKDACFHLEKIRSYGFFTHVSGNTSISFAYGFFLYCINDQQVNFELEDPTSYQYQPSPEMPLHNLSNRWFEVMIKRDDFDDGGLCGKHRLSSNLDLPQGKSGAFYVTAQKSSPKRNKTITDTTNKVVKIPLTNKVRNHRTEWCQVKYSPRVRTGINTFVFCFEFHWMVATATCLFNLLMAWLREAARCHLYFFPVPVDPFALPSAKVTGPLRSPLFVPLNLLSLLDASEKFKDYKETAEEYRDMILAMMEAILYRFGFVRDEFDDNGVDDKRINSVSKNYIHCTGQVLAQIPVSARSVQRHSISLRRRPSVCQKSELSSRSATPPVTNAELEATGFYWSFNYMQTKRWRIPQLDDCPPADLERDFVQFCADSESRLKDFFENFIEIY